MALEIRCPRCGVRPYTEFTYGGEWRELGATDPEEDFTRVFLGPNPAGPQRERWFHMSGCRRWLTLTRDTARNVVLEVEG